MFLTPRARGLLGAVSLGIGTLTSHAAAQIPGDHVLATFDGGQVTVDDMRGRWWMTRFPQEGVDVLLGALSASPEESETALGDLANEVREVALDHMAAAVAAEEGWASDLVFRHAAHGQVVPRTTGEVFRQVMLELPEPSAGVLAPHVSEEIARRTTPERRAVRLLTIPNEGAEGPSEEERALAQEILNRLEAGEESGELADEFSEGPGWSGEGELAPLSRDQAPWTELGDAIFAAAAGGTPSIHDVRIGLCIISVTDVQEANVPTADEVRRAAVMEWRRGEIQRRQAEIVEQWGEELDVTVNPLGLVAGQVAVTIGSDEITAEEFLSLPDDALAGTLEEAVNRFITTELAARRLGDHLPEGETERRVRAALTWTLRREWERRLTEDIVATGDDVRRMYDELVEAGSLPHPTTRRVLLCRVRPHDLHETPTADSLRLWRGLDAEAERVRGALLPTAASPEAFEARVRALEAESPYAIEFLDMDHLSEPPTFLRLVFFRMRAGDVSDVIAPVEDARLIYAVADVRERQAPPFEQAAGTAEATFLMRQREPVLQEARHRLMEERGLTLTFEGSGP